VSVCVSVSVSVSVVDGGASEGKTSGGVRQTDQGLAGRQRHARNGKRRTDGFALLLSVDVEVRRALGQEGQQTQLRSK
jgi:hypothetical protein